MKKLFLLILLCATFILGFSQTDIKCENDKYIVYKDGSILAKTRVIENEATNVYSFPTSLPDSVNITMSYEDFVTIKRLIQSNERASNTDKNKIIEAIENRIRYFKK